MASGRNNVLSIDTSVYTGDLSCRVWGNGVTVRIATRNDACNGSHINRHNCRTAMRFSVDLRLPASPHT